MCIRDSVMGGDIFVLIHAGGIIGRLVRFAVEMRCFGPDQPFGGLVGPVSYTHLDVYKRQGKTRFRR